MPRNHGACATLMFNAFPGICRTILCSKVKAFVTGILKTVIYCVWTVYLYNTVRMYLVLCIWWCYEIVMSSKFQAIVVLAIPRCWRFVNAADESVVTDLLGYE